MSSPPEFVGLFESLKFKFVMSVDDAMSCDAWITNNFVQKITEVEQYIFMALEDSLCGASISCVANSLFTCEKDSSMITYE